MSTHLVSRKRDLSADGVTMVQISDVHAIKKERTYKW